jgi:hypothetical protein
MRLLEVVLVSEANRIQRSHIKVCPNFMCQSSFRTLAITVFCRARDTYLHDIVSSV